jgi:hypothetical protein
MCTLRAGTIRPVWFIVVISRCEGTGDGFRVAANRRNGAADRLAKKGGTLIAQPEGFFVKGSEGPLKDNELERASAWVKSAMKA